LYSSGAIIFILFSSRNILVLVHYQAAVSHRVSSVLRLFLH